MGSHKRKAGQMADAEGVQTQQVSDRLTNRKRSRPSEPPPVDKCEVSAHEEPVWILGLINNIEQMLSTMNAAQHSGQVSMSMAGSIPSSCRSSMPASPLSSAVPSPPSCSSSCSANSPGHHAGSALPKSPVSRQIKFHEYKGPPAQKRNQTNSINSQPIESAVCRQTETPAGKTVTHSGRARALTATCGPPRPSPQPPSQPQQQTKAQQHPKLKPQQPQLKAHHHKAAETPDLSHARTTSLKPPGSGSCLAAVGRTTVATPDTSPSFSSQSKLMMMSLNESKPEAIQQPMDCWPPMEQPSSLKKRPMTPIAAARPSPEANQSAQSSSLWLNHADSSLDDPASPEARDLLDALVQSGPEPATDSLYQSALEHVSEPPLPPLICDAPVGSATGSQQSHLQQVEAELLFSEFIDLQDVPMNVSESDWLKKFLPPCSLGSLING